jgi:hypothetical protein
MIGAVQEFVSIWLLSHKTTQRNLQTCMIHEIAVFAKNKLATTNSLIHLISLFPALDLEHLAIFFS